MAVERVFSLLNSSFGEQQEKALQDYVETCYAQVQFLNSET